MSVILFILKLIGTILLVLLGIIVALLLLVLFVPIRYYVSGELETEIAVHAKVTWLLHLISFVVDYEKGEAVTSLRILGIRKKAKGKRKSALEEEAWKDEPEDAAWDEADTESADEPEEKLETEQTDKAWAETGASDETAESRMVSGSLEKEHKEKPSRIQKFLDTVRRLKNALGQLRRKASSVKEIITDEANQNIVKAVLAELRYLLKHFKFRKLVTNLRFSAGDPAATGQALGVMCLFPILYRYQVSVIPDFEAEEFYIKGTFEVKGHVRTVHLVVTLLHLWKKKEVRDLVKKLLDK